MIVIIAMVVKTVVEVKHFIIDVFEFFGYSKEKEERFVSWTRSKQAGIKVKKV